MSRMAELDLELQTQAIKYLAAQGIDEELIWDAAEDNYERVNELARLHKEANGRLTNLTEQALRALLVVDRYQREVVIG